MAIRARDEARDIIGERAVLELEEAGLVVVHHSHLADAIGRAVRETKRCMDTVHAAGPLRWLGRALRTLEPIHKEMR